MGGQICGDSISCALCAGFIVDFISVPVITAFVSASSLIIVGAQLKSFFGISYSSRRFVDALWELYVRLDSRHAGDMWLAAVCCGFLLGVRVSGGIRS